MKKLVILFLLASSLFLQAAPISYTFFVDTILFNGQDGSLDFQFNPGSAPGQDLATAIVSGFSGGMLGAGTGTGDVSGDLAASVTFNNTSGLNRWSQEILFTDSFQFTLTVSGALLDNPQNFIGSTFSTQLDQGETNRALVILDIIPTLDPILSLNGSVTQQTVIPEPEQAWVLLLGVPVVYLLRWRKIGRAAA